MKRMLSTIASLLLSVFFICIILFMMLEVFEIQDSDTGTRSFVFTSIDFLIIIITIGFGKQISHIVKTGMYPPIVVSTVVYSIANITFNIAGCDMESTAIFTLINLAMLFVYCCVVIPLAVTGSGQPQQQENSEPIRMHNINNQ